METESIKIKKTLVSKLRTNKEKTGVSIQKYVEQAVEEKMKRDRKKT